MASNIGGIVKLGVLGVGGYMLWRWWQDQTQDQTPAPGSAAAADRTAGVMSELESLILSLKQTSAGGVTSGGTAPQQKTPVTQGPAPPLMVNEPTYQMLLEAAADPAKASLGGRKLLNWHQWNWHREQADASLPRYAPEDAGMGNGSALITALQYHEALKARGLAAYRRTGSGFRGIGGLVPAGSPYQFGRDYLTIAPVFPVRRRVGRA